MLLSDITDISLLESDLQKLLSVFKQAFQIYKKCFCKILILSLDFFTNAALTD